MCHFCNTKYNFLFNHESPGHANLFQTQNWEGGKFHYIDNDFTNFKNRFYNDTPPANNAPSVDELTTNADDVVTEPFVVYAVSLG